MTLWNQGRWEEAEQLEVQVMETSKKKLGEDYSSTLTSMNNLAFTWKAQRRDANTLYPPTFTNSSSSLYDKQYNRTALTIADFEFNCNERYLAFSQPNTTHSFIFAVPPGLHGENVQYLFFDGDTTTLDDWLPVNETFAAL